MKDNKGKFNISILIIIVLLLIIAGLVFYIVTNNNEEISNISNDVKEISDYFILYKGYEIKKETGVQFLTEMEITEKAEEKYNITYYNYENGGYFGKINGNVEPVYDEYFIVDKVKKIAISEEYDAIPRKFEDVDDFPNEFFDDGYTDIYAQSIDLDRDGKNEYIVNYILDEDGKASSKIVLYDYNFEKIAELVNLENGFWANIIQENYKVFVTLDDIEYIDIDNDGIMEIIVDIPVYEGYEISILKYNNGTIEGTTDIEATVLP